MKTIQLKSNDKTINAFLSFDAIEIDGIKYRLGKFDLTRLAIWCEDNVNRQPNRTDERVDPYRDYIGAKDQHFDHK